MVSDKSVSFIPTSNVCWREGNDRQKQDENWEIEKWRRYGEVKDTLHPRHPHPFCTHVMEEQRNGEGGSGRRNEDSREWEGPEKLDEEFNCMGWAGVTYLIATVGLVWSYLPCGEGTVTSPKYRLTTCYEHMIIIRLDLIVRSTQLKVGKKK